MFLQFAATKVKEIYNDLSLGEQAYLNIFSLIPNLSRDTEYFFISIVSSIHIQSIDETLKEKWPLSIGSYSGVRKIQKQLEKKGLIHKNGEIIERYLHDFMLITINTSEVSQILGIILNRLYVADHISCIQGRFDLYRGISSDFTIIPDTQIVICCQQWFGDHVDPKLITEFILTLRQDIHAYILEYALYKRFTSDEKVDFIDQVIDALEQHYRTRDPHPIVSSKFFDYHLLKGQWHQISADSMAAAALTFFNSTTTKLGHATFLNEIKNFRKTIKSRTWSPNYYWTPFLLLAALASDVFDLKDFEKIQEPFKKMMSKNIYGYRSGDHPFSFIKAAVLCLDVLKDYMQGKKTLLPIKKIEENIKSPLVKAFFMLVSYLANRDTVSVVECQKFFKQTVNTHPLMAKIIADVLLKLDPTHKEALAFVQSDSFANTIDFTTLFDIKERWHMALDSLSVFFNQMHSQDDENKNANREKRLAWFYNLNTHTIDSVFEQTLSRTNKWTKGKNLSLRKVCDPSIHDIAIPQDRPLIRAIRQERALWSSVIHYEWNPIAMHLALDGHPHVFDAQNPDQQLYFSVSKPELVIEQKDTQNFKLSLSHIADQETIFVEKEGKNLVHVTHFDPQMIPLAEIFTSKGIDVPQKAKDQIISIVQKAGLSLPVLSNVEDIDIQAQPADTNMYIQLEPRGDREHGLFAQLLVRPFGDKGPYFKPGQGRPHVQMVENLVPIKAKRDLALEKQNAQHVLNACPTLRERDNDTYEWDLDDPLACLETLADLKDFEETRTENPDQHPFLLKIEWPKGRRMKMTDSVGFNNIKLRIHKNRDWFNVDADIKVDENTVIGLKQMLQLLDQSKGRFIQLDDNKFIALTNNLKKQLQELRYVGEEDKNGFKVHNLGSHMLSTLAQQVEDLDVDDKWKTRVKQLDKVSLSKPKLPTTLQADLRDYQKDGFDWMHRLAQLDMGACLADDMGLGKTVQALSMLLTYAEKGPCLVVAPTSVCHNWHQEIEKFAPTLTSYGFDNTDRAELINKLGAMDVLICSYTLLQQEIELLEKKEFSMIVLDEAQAIKNSTTKRFQAAIKLNGHFRLALSGTPIENSLEELWSLFRFITPGLLGSKDSFNKRFLSASTKEDEQNKRHALKNLIKAFVMRRTKSSVLSELPPKTEQTVYIDMDDNEKAFYEAVRQSAIDNIAKSDDHAGKRKIHILAELTRLRRACCHPRLVNDAIDIQSSKMRIFGKLVEELLENNHKALVFSQYVGYLDLVREQLDRMQVSYQYLDGSTSAADRQKQVNAFQSGESSIFLLSLKAGGSGLNLTEADYVIHLDPWWNPAVEDQASDRAHRMGQTRPVTIYRLVMKDSIEEKILALHNDKRELADELLEGSSSPHKLSEADLMNLLQAA